LVAWNDFSSRVGEGGVGLWERERSRWIDWRLKRRSDDRDVGKAFARARAKDLVVVRRRQTTELKVRTVCVWH
jgi:hypothetical protein